MVFSLFSCQGPPKITCQLAAGPSYQNVFRDTSKKQRFEWKTYKGVSHGAHPTRLGNSFPMRGVRLFWTLADKERRQHKCKNAPRGPVELSRACSFVHTLASDKSWGMLENVHLFFHARRKSLDARVVAWIRGDFLRTSTPIHATVPAFHAVRVKSPIRCKYIFKHVHAFSPFFKNSRPTSS